ncbi:hypothetical protein C4O30_06540 [Lactiplantibacillus plantarum]|nr:hypothetical protein C4O30_06540 [Lactiplantibacillus plantarum]
MVTAVASTCQQDLYLTILNYVIANKYKSLLKPPVVQPARLGVFVMDNNSIESTLLVNASKRLH